jgi:hypothetical protein
MDKQQFIGAVAAYVEKYADSYEIYARSAVIAQAILESGWGESTLAAVYHNYFGLKCGTKWTGKSVNLKTQEEYEAGTLTTITDNFRVYDSMEDGIKGYFEFIQLPRYSNLRGIRDSEKYLQTIKDDGYATSSTYASSCMAIVNQFDLTQYDTAGNGEAMTTYIAQASCDENGKYVGGQAGNQSGTELNTRALWDNNWLTLVVWKSATAANACATAASRAVANMHIGYDQGERNTILPPAEAAGYDLSKITKNCECDCSSLASVCGIAAGAAKSIMYEGGNLGYTGNLASRLKSTGLVTVYQGLSYSDICAKAQVGSILVSSGHAVIVVSGNAPSGSSSGSTSTVVGGTIDELAQAVIAGRYGTGEARKAALGDKYDAVQARVNELLLGTPNAAGTSTGTPRIIAGTYKVVASSLNVRDAPGVSGNVVAAYGYGELIYSIAADVVEKDGYTWAHYTSYSDATRYVAVGTSNGSEKYLVKA